jgi:flagellin-like protein
MKGISPIIASVLLIAITMSIAVILAAYVTNYTRTATQSIPSTCIGGALFVDGTPTCTGTALSVNLEANYVSLSGFKVDTEDSSGNIIQTGLTMLPSTTLAPSQIGTYTATVTACAAVAQIRVTTGNCFNVMTGWTAV